MCHYNFIVSSFANRRLSENCTSLIILSLWNELGSYIVLKLFQTVSIAICFVAVIIDYSQKKKSKDSTGKHTKCYSLISDPTGSSGELTAYETSNVKP